ncbi:hypothetical protein diail_10228 [Diaporthe ilicicola]|nr:hypothetical protein diail_10228 [Diaporthe ilicicola]
MGAYELWKSCLPSTTSFLSSFHQIVYPDIIVVKMEDSAGMAIAFEEAKQSYSEGGIPVCGTDTFRVSDLTITYTQIGAALVSKDGKLLGRGHNQRVQLGSATQPTHKQGETSALFNSGRLPARAYQGSTMYTTLSPCDMCTGACLLYGIARVVIGENENFLGGEAYLRSRGVEVVVVGDAGCKQLMDTFIAEKPELWYVCPPLAPPEFALALDYLRSPLAFLVLLSMKRGWLINLCGLGMRISGWRRGCTPRSKTAGSVLAGE